MHNVNLTKEGKAALKSLTELLKSKGFTDKEADTFIDNLIVITEDIIDDSLEDYDDWDD